MARKEIDSKNELIIKLHAELEEKNVRLNDFESHLRILENVLTEQEAKLVAAEVEQDSRMAQLLESHDSALTDKDAQIKRLREIVASKEASAMEAIDNLRSHKLATGGPYTPGGLIWKCEEDLRHTKWVRESCNIRHENLNRCPEDWVWSLIMQDPRLAGKFQYLNKSNILSIINRFKKVKSNLAVTPTNLVPKDAELREMIRLIRIVFGVKFFFCTK
eukprot:GHVO01042931.1.p1 GENE.GHVO01042931.1~~GHVO01042931.1.p1  ORF type:complete len:218 (+),score=35.04 GHVO01042931.1:320-973(+)